MIEHVCEGNLYMQCYSDVCRREGVRGVYQGRSSHSVNCHSKVPGNRTSSQHMILQAYIYIYIPAAYDHPRPHEFLERKTREGGVNLTDDIIVTFDGFLSLSYLMH
jgi:hypothetical protein